MIEAKVIDTVYWVCHARKLVGKCNDFDTFFVLPVPGLVENIQQDYYDQLIKEGYTVNEC